MAKSDVHYAAAGALAKVSFSVDNARIATRRKLTDLLTAANEKTYNVVEKLNKLTHNLYYSGAKAKVTEARSDYLDAQARRTAALKVADDSLFDLTQANDSYIKAIELEQKYSKNVTL